MFAGLQDVLARHSTAVREAEALVYHAGHAGVAAVKQATEDWSLDEASRGYWCLVARIAEKRYTELCIPDLRTAHDIAEGWTRRPGQMIG